MHPTEEQLNEYRQKHGEIEVKPMGDITVVFRTPTLPEWEAFLDTSLSDKRSKAKAMRAVTIGCVVFPDARTVSEHMAKKPGRVSSGFEAVSKLANDDDAFLV